ncbi:hypothetical protein AAU61_10100 [Desulfocarbo indianensis]|nr:hypothetical protein AAU61_10100 [Desulfocarbo indianensis]
MKITNETIAALDQYQNKQVKNNTQGSGFSFERALTQELEGTPAITSGQGIQPSILETVTGGDANGNGVPPQWFQINGMVDTLDRYSSALADPNYTLKDIEPLAEEMEELAQTLQDSLAKGDFGPLQQLAEETLTQARVQAIKFRRGDYV